MVPYYIFLDLGMKLNPNPMNNARKKYSESCEKTTRKKTSVLIEIDILNNNPFQHPVSLSFSVTTAIQTKECTRKAKIQKNLPQRRTC